MLNYDPDQDAYVVLGVAANAKPAAIEAAYRRAALTWHPDKTSAPDAAERFQEIRRAATILRDPRKRADYDRLRAMHIGVRAQYHQTKPPPQKSAYAPLGPAPIWMSDRVKVHFDAVVLNLRLAPVIGRHRWADAAGFLSLVLSITLRDVKFAALALVCLFIARVLAVPPHQGILAWAKIIPGRRLAEYHMLDRRTSRYENWTVPFQQLGVAIMPRGSRWYIQVVGFPNAATPELGVASTVAEAKHCAREASRWLQLPLREAA